MKRSAYCLFLFFLSYNFVSAQDRVMLSAGINYNSLPASSNVKLDLEQGYEPFLFAGVGYCHAINENWKLTGMFQYSQKGGILYNPGITSSKVTSRHDFADLLVTVERKIVGPLAIYVGGDIYYLLRANMKKGQNFQEFAFIDLFNRWGIGSIAGANFSFGRFGISAHWNRSFTNLIDFSLTNELGDEIGYRREKTNTFQLGIFITL